MVERTSAFLGYLLASFQLARDRWGIIICFENLFLWHLGSSPGITGKLMLKGRTLMHYSAADKVQCV